jgi:hypothetical protein
MFLDSPNKTIPPLSPVKILVTVLPTSLHVEDVVDPVPEHKNSGSGFGSVPEIQWNDRSSHRHSTPSFLKNQECKKL